MTVSGLFKILLITHPGMNDAATGKEIVILSILELYFSNFGRFDFSNEFFHGMSFVDATKHASLVRIAEVTVDRISKSSLSHRFS